MYHKGKVLMKNDRTALSRSKTMIYLSCVNHSQQTLLWSTRSRPLLPVGRYQTQIFPRRRNKQHNHYLLQSQSNSQQSSQKLSGSQQLVKMMLQGTVHSTYHQQSHRYGIYNYARDLLHTVTSFCVGCKSTSFLELVINLMVHIVYVT